MERKLSARAANLSNFSSNGSQRPPCAILLVQRRQTGRVQARQKQPRESSEAPLGTSVTCWQCPHVYVSTSFSSLPVSRFVTVRRPPRRPWIANGYSIMSASTSMLVRAPPAICVWNPMPFAEAGIACSSPSGL